MLEEMERGYWNLGIVDLVRYRVGDGGRCRVYVPRVIDIQFLQ